MKKINLILSIGALLLAACQDFDYGDLPQSIDEEALNHAALVLGVKIDPNQDWNTINSGKVSITADADMDDIVKVQILTESPFYNVDARVLTETEVTNGQSVTLTYNAPNTYTQLIAACVNSKGKYYIQAFEVGTSEVSFVKNEGTRAVATDKFPDLTNVKLNYHYSTPSYNARRTMLADEAAKTGDATLQQWVKNANLTPWQGRKWENERLWGAKASGEINLSNGWKWINNTIVREISPIDEKEASTLKTIFNNYLGRAKMGAYKVQDNMENLRKSDIVNINHNNLCSTGDAPITVIPVQMPSTEANKCVLYYYYYDPKNIPAGFTEEEYLKELPKFKALQLDYTQQAAGISSGSDEFFNKLEYLLPYYGDPNKLINMEEKGYSMCKTDGKLYRIRNGQQLKNESYYITYLGKNGGMDNKLATKYGDNADNISNQLWQIFRTPDGKVLLYNVGGKVYLCPEGEYTTIMSSDVEKNKADLYVISQEGDYYRIWRSNSWNAGKGSYSYCLGTDLTVKNSLRVSTNKTIGDGERTKWYLEEYTGAKWVEKQNNFVYSCEIKAESAIIPEGFKVGFMLRKSGGSQVEKDNSDLSAVKNGCCYGDGRLNTEINQLPGHFGSSHTKYSMELDDPRIAMFEANNKSYMTFEDGADCNFSDLIIEFSGGIKSIDYLNTVYPQVYTFCFEDRAFGDYDMNDVVIKATRLSATLVEFSLEACGGTDEVYLCGLDGSKVFNNKAELHQILEGTSSRSPINVFGTITADPVHEQMEVDPLFDFNELKKKLYIKNVTMGKDVFLAGAGEDPHAVMIADDFQYPTEGVAIQDAYPEFLNWASNADAPSDWYKTPVVERIITSIFDFIWSIFK